MKDCATPHKTCSWYPSPNKRPSQIHYSWNSIGFPNLLYFFIGIVYRLLKVSFMFGSYQLYTCNNDPELFMSVFFGMYDGTCENIQLGLWGNEEKGWDGVLTPTVKRVQPLCDKGHHWLVLSVTPTH